MTKKKVFEVYVNPDCVRIDNAFNNLLKQVGDHVEFELPDWFNKWKPPYTFIRRNLYLTKKIKRRIEDDGIFCSCKPSSASSSVCGRDCHCGMLLSSCSSSCKCGSSCINKPFHQRPVKKMKLVKAATKISALKQLQSALGVPQDDLDMLNLDIHQAEEAVTTPCEEFDLPPIPTPYMGSRKGVRVDPIIPSNSSIRSEEAEADDDEESDASRGVSEEGSGSTDSALLQEDTGGPQGSVDKEPVGGHGEQVENLEPIVSANQVAQVSIQGATGDVGGAQLQATNAEAQPQTSNIPDVPQDSSPSPARVSPRLDDPFVDSHAKRRKGSSGIGDTALEAAAATALLQVSLALVSLPQSSTALPLSSIPPQHGAVEATGVAGSRMVNFKGGLVNPRVPAIIERVQAKFPTTFSNLKCRSPHFVSLTYESMARTVSVLDKHSMNTISSKDLKFLESTISDMELNGADVSWLKAPMDVLRQMKVLGDKRLAVERLEAAAAEAAKVAKATKKAAEEAQKKAEEAQRKAEEAANLLEAEGTLETEKCGSGVVADEDIKRGEFVIEYVGEVIDDKTCEERLWEMKRRGETNFYLCEINRDMVIDATYKGNKSRYINHSCCPNTEMQKWRIDGETRIGIFATRDINKGDHLTYDYQFVQFGADQDCHCGASGCRQKLGVKPSKPKISSEAALKLVVCQVAVSSPKLKAISSGNDVYQNGGLHIGNLQHAPNKQKTQCRNCIGEVIVITRPINKRYFGIIKRFDKFSRKHSIMFEDGRVEFLDMSKEEWEFVNLL